MLSSLLCLWYGHKPKRHSALGGWRCERCPKVGGDLDDLGYHGQGYVSPLRSKFERDPSAVSRLQRWHDKESW